MIFGWVDLLGNIVYLNINPLQIITNDYYGFTVAFGGIAGLFLGFSLLSGVEIIYYFTLRACCMVANDPEVLEKIGEEYDHQDKPIINLGLKPLKADDDNKTSAVINKTNGKNGPFVLPYLP